MASAIEDKHSAPALQVEFSSPEQRPRLVDLL